MKLSDIKGEKSLDIMADAMELAELIADDARFKEMLEELKSLGEDRSGTWRVFCKHVPPIMRDKRYKGRIVSILAAASDMDAKQYAKEGPVLADLYELLTSDAETLGFLLGTSASAG